MGEIPGRDDQRTGRTAPAPKRLAQNVRGAGRTLSQTLAVLLLVFVTVVLVLFAVFNTQTVQVSLVFGDVQAPLVVALVIAALLGGVVAGLLGAVLQVRRGRRDT
jgi:uncharacterized integral membrane protein